jgi:hypothetical protein
MLPLVRARPICMVRASLLPCGGDLTLMPCGSKLSKEVHGVLQAKAESMEVAERTNEVAVAPLRQEVQRLEVCGMGGRGQAFASQAKCCWLGLLAWTCVGPQVAGGDYFQIMPLRGWSSSKLSDTAGACEGAAAAVQQRGGGHGSHSQAAGGPSVSAWQQQR